MHKFFYKFLNSCLLFLFLERPSAWNYQAVPQSFAREWRCLGKKLLIFSGDEYQHKKLNATPTATNSVPTIFHCLKNCSFEISCFSINYQQVTATCQLLQENVYTNASLMVNSSDWTHVSVFVRDLCGFLLILVYYMLSNYFNESIGRLHWWIFL